MMLLIVLEEKVLFVLVTLLLIVLLSLDAILPHPLPLKTSLNLLSFLLLLFILFLLLRSPSFIRIFHPSLRTWFPCFRSLLLLNRLRIYLYSSLLSLVSMFYDLTINLSDIVLFTLLDLLFPSSMLLVA